MSLPTNSLSMAPRAPDPRLGDSEGAILHWDLSSPTPGTPTPTASFSTATASTLLASHTTSPSTAALSSPAPQISPRATLSQAHDSNIWALTFYLLGHLLASNDHTTRFCARKRPGDATSVFAPGDTKPAATGPDNDADGDQDDEDGSLVVPGFGGSAAGADGGAPPVLSWAAAVCVPARTMSCPGSAVGEAVVLVVLVMR
jgi:polyadenylation factor subunit 2